MAFTFDVTTDVGKVRLLIPDRVAGEPIFEDEEIEAILALEDDNVRRAAAMALETIASDQAYTLKAITSLGLTTNGPAVAKSLLDRADKLRSQADKADADAEAAEDGGLFDIAEMTHTAFAYRERLVKEAQRYG